MDNLLIDSPDRRGTDSVKWGIYGDDVLPLWVADLDFTSPPAVIEALKTRIEHGVFGYPKESKELKELITARMEKRYGWKISNDDILLLPGVVSGFNLVCQAVTQPGESILLQPPVYPPFFSAPEKAGAKSVFNEIQLNATDEYEIDFDDFESAILPDTRCFMLCNPHNPIGKVFTRDELTRISDICLRKNVIICSDEIHSDLIFGKHQHVPTASISPEVSDITTTLIAPSKTYNIAGLECSALICTNAELRTKINHARRGLLGGVNVLGLTAGIAAYRHGDEWLTQLMETLEGNLDFLLKYINEKMPSIKMVRPDATYLAWLDCRAANLPESPYKFFLDNAKVALNNGLDFGEPGRGFARLNFGCSREILSEALNRMSSALAGR